MRETEVGTAIEMLPKVAIIAPIALIPKLIVKMINAGYMPINGVNQKTNLTDIHIADCFYATKFATSVELSNLVLNLHALGKKRISKMNFLN